MSGVGGGGSSRQLSPGYSSGSSQPAALPGGAPTALPRGAGQGEQLRLRRALAGAGLGLGLGLGGGAARLLAGRAGGQPGPLALAHHLGGDLAGRPQEAPHRRGQQAGEEEALAAARRLPGGGRQAQEAAGDALLRDAQRHVGRRQQWVSGGQRLLRGGRAGAVHDEAEHAGPAQEAAPAARRHLPPRAAAVPAQAPCLLREQVAHIGGEAAAAEGRVSPAGGGAGS